MLHIVLLQFAIESRLADPQHACGSKFVAARFAQRAQNRASFQLFERQQFLFLLRAFARRIVQARRQISHVNDRAGAQRHGALDGVLQFADVSRPVVGHQPAHGVFRDSPRRSLRVRELVKKRGHQEWDVALASFSRKYKSCRKLPLRMAASRSRLVAAMIRTSMRRRSVEPTGFTSRSCRTRNSLACRSTGKSPISSRNNSPPFAASTRPCFACTTPLNAPFTQPNNSDSI